MLTLGCDLSHYQPRTDYAAVHAAGYAFGYLKVTEGLTVSDDLASTHWAGLGAVGMLRGCYHFFRATSPGRAQARRFVEAVAKLGTTDLPMCLDVEADNGLPRGEVADGVVDAVHELATLTGRRPLLYCGPGFWSTLPAGPCLEVARLTDLWVAHYTTATHPLLPHGWSRYALWQYSGDATVPGIHGGADVDRFDGSLEELRAWGTGGPLPDAPAPVSSRWTTLDVQRALNKLHVSAVPLAEDGIHGARTRDAVRVFQSMHDLDIDGVAGAATVDALRRALSA